MERSAAMKAILRTLFLLLSTQLISAQVKDSGGIPITEVTSCSPDDFQDGQNCTLICTLRSHIPIIDMYAYFKYYTTPTSSSVAVYGYIEDQTGFPYNYTVSLELSTYNAGTYQCNFDYSLAIIGQSYTSKHDFKISSQEGSYMNDYCDDATECLALNAQCDSTSSYDGSNRCNCNGVYSISYSSSGDNPACLKHEDAGESCVTVEECEDEVEDYTCMMSANDVVGICMCPGSATLIHVEEENRTMCLEQVELLYPCVYDEECSDDRSVACKDGVCNCNSGYQVDSTWDNCISTAPFNMEVKSCTPGDFTATTNCTLSCSVTYADDGTYTFSGGHWLYNDIDYYSVSVLLLDGKVVNSGEEHTATLELATYNAGYYICQFTWIEVASGVIETVTNVFHIPPAGTDYPIDAYCDISTECNSLNAQCVDVFSSSSKTCYCWSSYPIEYQGNCYAYSEFGEPCNIDQQCTSSYASITCQNFTCTCNSYEVFVAETNSVQCIYPAYLDSSCRYNEECTLYTSGTFCDGGVCRCVDGCHDFGNYCNCSMMDWTAGAIAGVVIGGVAGLAFVVGAIYGIVWKCRKEKKGNNTHQHQET